MIQFIFQDWFQVNIASGLSVQQPEMLLRLTNVMTHERKVKRQLAVGKIYLTTGRIWSANGIIKCKMVKSKIVK
jgi:hypothetical protein